MGTETILQLALVTALPWACPWALGIMAEEAGTNQGVWQEDGQGGCHTLLSPRVVG